MRTGLKRALLIVIIVVCVLVGLSGCVFGVNIPVIGEQPYVKKDYFISDGNRYSEQDIPIDIVDDKIIQADLRLIVENTLGIESIDDKYEQDIAKELKCKRRWWIDKQKSRIKEGELYAYDYKNDKIVGYGESEEIEPYGGDVVNTMLSLVGSPSDNIIYVSSLHNELYMGWGSKHDCNKALWGSERYKFGYSKRHVGHGLLCIDNCSFKQDNWNPNTSNLVEQKSYSYYWFILTPAQSYKDILEIYNKYSTGYSVIRNYNDVYEKVSDKDTRELLLSLLDGSKRA